MKSAYSAAHLDRPGVTFAVEIEDPKERIQAYLDTYQPGPGDIDSFDSALMQKHLKLVSATASPKITATFELKVIPALCNRLDNLHGGAVSLIYDMCTTMAMAPASRLDFWHFGGVSRNLSITFFKPSTLGMDILIECELLQIGRRLATISGKMISKEDGKLLSVAEHNKASIVFGSSI